jgi:hypothetical protein
MPLKRACPRAYQLLGLLRFKRIVLPEAAWRPYPRAAGLLEGRRLRVRRRATGRGVSVRRHVRLSSARRGPCGPIVGAMSCDLGARGYGRSACLGYLPERQLIEAFCEVRDRLLGERVRHGRMRRFRVLITPSRAIVWLLAQLPPGYIGVHVFGIAVWDVMSMCDSAAQVSGLLAACRVPRQVQ